MTYTATTAFDFIDALAEQLRGRAGLAAVDVRTGMLLEYKDALYPDFIEIMRSEVDSDPEYLTAPYAASKVREFYHVVLEITVFRPGQTEADIQAARDRLEAIVVEVATELRTNWTMNDTVVRCLPGTPAIDNYPALDVGREAKAIWAISVWGLIEPPA